MDIHEHQGGLTVRRSDLSGSVFDDANLPGAAITASRYDGTTIDGIAVPDLLAAWRRQSP